MELAEVFCTSKQVAKQDVAQVVIAINFLGLPDLALQHIHQFPLASTDADPSLAHAPCPVHWMPKHPKIHMPQALHPCAPFTPMYASVPHFR